MASPFRARRSATVCRFGLVYVPTLRPLAMSSDDAIADVDPLPLVPVMWMEGMESWGSPRSAVRARMRSSVGKARRRGMLDSKSMWSSSHASASSSPSKGGGTARSGSLRTRRGGSVPP